MTDDEKQPCYLLASQAEASPSHFEDDLTGLCALGQSEFGVVYLGLRRALVTQPVLTAHTKISQRKDREADIHTDKSEHAYELSHTLVYRIAGVPSCACACPYNESMACLGPTASPTTVPLFVLEHQPCSPSDCAFSAVHLRKNTRCTLPV